MNSPSAEIPGSGIPSATPGASTAVPVSAPTPPGGVTSVPEPSPLFLLVGALALVFLLKRGGGTRS